MTLYLQENGMNHADCALEKLEARRPQNNAFKVVNCKETRHAWGPPLPVWRWGRQERMEGGIRAKRLGPGSASL